LRPILAAVGKPPSAVVLWKEYTVGDKGGKKNKDKNQKQKAAKQKQEAKKKQDKQQKSAT